MKYNNICIIFVILFIFFMFYKKKENFREILPISSKEIKTKDPRYKDFVNFSWERWNPNDKGWFNTDEPKIYQYNKVWPD